MFPPNFIFSPREQQEDIFFDTDASFNLQTSLTNLSTFQKLLKTQQHHTQQDYRIPTDYLLVINEDDENKNKHKFSLKFQQDQDCLLKNLLSLERCLKDELYSPIGLLHKPTLFNYSLTLNDTFVPLMSKSFITSQDTSTSFLPEKKFLKKIIDTKRKLKAVKEEEEDEKLSVYYVPKKPFLNNEDFQTFMEQVIPIEEFNLFKSIAFQGQNTLRNIATTVLDRENVNVAILPKVRQLLNKQNKTIFFETTYQYDNSKESSKNNKLPRKSFLKSIFDRLVNLKKQFDDVTFQWILSIDNKKQIEEEKEKEEEKDKSRKTKTKNPTEFDVKQYFLGNDVSKVLTFTELFSQVVSTDCGRAYTSFLALQNVIKPSIKEYIKNVLDSLKNEKKMVCEDVIVISKSYQSLQDALADNNKTIYFDEKFFNTVDNQETTKEVEDGHFAIVHNSNNDDDEDNKEGSIYLKRISNKWETYKQPVNIKDVILSNTKTFCELQPDCIKVNNDCKTIQSAETGLNETLLLHMQNQLNTEYNQTWLQILEGFEFSLLRLKVNQIPNHLHLQSETQSSKKQQQQQQQQQQQLLYQSQQSLRKYLNNKRLLKSDCLLKENWYVSKKTNIATLPLFVSYLKEGNAIKFQQYKVSSFRSDGDLEIDTKTGFTFKRIDFCVFPDNDFITKINKKYKNIYITNNEEQKQEQSQEQQRPSINWAQLLIDTFLSNTSHRDREFISKEFFDGDDDDNNKIVFEKVMSFIFILLQTKFCRIERYSRVERYSRIETKNKDDNLEQEYKGYPFFTSDFKDNEGLKLFGRQFYGWLELKRDLLPFDKLKTYFEFAKNEKVFVESFCKSISLYIENNLLHNPIFLSRVFTFRREIKQKNKKDKDNYFCISTWQRFLPELSNLNDFKYQVSNFVLKKYVSPDTLYIKSLLLSMKYQQFIQKQNNNDNDNHNNDKSKEDLTQSYFLHLFYDIDRKLHELWFKSSSYIFYKPQNYGPTFQYADQYTEETIYRCFIKYCKFNNNCPLYKKLADICDAVTTSSKTYTEEEMFELETTESYNNRISIELEKFDPIEFQIDKLKENGRKYNQDNLHQLLNFLHNQTKVNYINASSSFPTRTEALRKTIVLATQLYPENETFEKMNNLLDRFQFETNSSEKVFDEDYKDLLHFTKETNDKKIIKILECLSEKPIEKHKNGNIIVDKIENYSAKTFYNNFQRYFVVDEEQEKEKAKEKAKEKEKEKQKQNQKKDKGNQIEKNVRRHQLSDFDNLTLEMRNSIKVIVITIPSCIINKHNRTFGKSTMYIKKYFDNSSLDLKLKTIKEKGTLFIDLFENTCCLTDESIFDIKLTKQLFGYYLLSLFELFIDNELSVSMINDFANLFFVKDFFEEGEVVNKKVVEEEKEKEEEEEEEEEEIKTKEKEKRKLKDKLKDKPKVVQISLEEKEYFDNFSMTTII